MDSHMEKQTESGVIEGLYKDCRAKEYMTSTMQNQVEKNIADEMTWVFTGA